MDGLKRKTTKKFKDQIKQKKLGVAPLMDKKPASQTGVVSSLKQKNELEQNCIIAPCLEEQVNDLDEKVEREDKMKKNKRRSLTAHPVSARLPIICRRSVSIRNIAPLTNVDIQNLAQELNRCMKLTHNDVSPSKKR